MQMLTSVIAPQPQMPRIARQNAPQETSDLEDTNHDQQSNFTSPDIWELAPGRRAHGIHQDVDRSDLDIAYCKRLDPKAWSEQQ